MTSPVQSFPDTSPDVSAASSPRSFAVSENFMDDNEGFIKQVVDALTEYTSVCSLQEFTMCIDSIDSPLKWQLVIMQSFLITGDFSEQERNAIFELVLALFKQYKFDHKVVEGGLTCAFTFMEDMWVDCPHLSIYAGQILSSLVISSFVTLSTIYDLLPVVPEPKLRQAILGSTLQYLLKEVCMFRYFWIT